MRLIATLLLAALLVAPTVAASRAPLPYPGPLPGLAPRIVEHVAALEANASGASWWPDAKPWLDRARAHAAEGRFHATLYDAETFQEIVVGHQLQETANASAATAGDQRSFVIRTVASWHLATNATWDAFRARLHQADGNLRSLGALETALFAADLGASSKSTDGQLDGYLARFAREPQVPLDYLFVFARMTRTPALDVEVARDVLDAAFAQDGVPPAFLQDRWVNNTLVALAAPQNYPPQMQRFEDVATPARANNESILAVAIALAEQGESRLSGMATIFGDAASRGKSVVADADRGFQKQLNNSTLEPGRARGVAVLFMADAVDRGVYAQDVVDNGTATLGVVLGAWAAIDHAGYATNVLADVSPVKPPEAKRSPGVELPLLAAGLCLAALAGRRPRR